MDSGQEEGEKLSSRRELFQYGPLSLWGLIIAACKTQRSDRRSPYTPSSPLSPDPVENEDPNDDGLTEGSDEAQEQCSNMIDPATFDNVKENLTTEIKLYGDSTSALVVVNLPKYAHGNLKSVFLIRSSGEVLAQKGISDIADVRPNLTVRPLIFDNLLLKEERKVGVIFETTCSNCDGGIKYLKYIPEQDLTFETTFRGKPVQSISPTSNPDNYYTYQAYPDFLPILDEITRNRDRWQVQSDSSVYDASGGLQGFIITDLGGEILSENGLNVEGGYWADIMNHQMIACYKLVSDQFYVRTLLRLG